MDQETWHVEGYAVEVTHLHKLFWPEDNLTKGDLLKYYRGMGPVMLPYFRKRPVTLHVFPDGIHGVHYYRRDIPEYAPSWIQYINYPTERGRHVIQVPVINHLASLIWSANLGSIEFHLWGAHLPDITRPDMAFFDLDPGESISFRHVLEAAWYLHLYLKERGIKGFAKTSGGRGLHVYIPLITGYTFEYVRSWVKHVAQELARQYPSLIAVAHGATHKGARVTIDYAQNSRGRNMAAPYTVRAHPGAPVSTPLTWQEVQKGTLSPGMLTMRTVPERVKRLGDIFHPVLTHKQKLSPFS